MSDRINEVIKEYGTIEDYILATDRRQRADKGKKRIKYDSSLPPKYKSYLMRANQKGMEMTLTVEEFENICSQSCKFCGSDSKIGVDRIDSSEGYTVDNSQPCCPKCNMMKYTYSIEEFLKHIDKIHKYLSL